MPTDTQSEVTELLEQWRDGDPEALEQLLPLVYGMLRSIAARHLRRERHSHTLQPTALVHETYMRLTKHTRLQWRDRAHFFAISARIMRRLLVDHARERSAAKRGGDWERVELEDNLGVSTGGLDMLDLDSALSKLEAIDERQARVVEARYFAGLSIEETAEALGISKATVKREWATARVFLFLQLEENAPHSPSDARSDAVPLSRPRAKEDPGSA